jgi:hypothetical protein
LGTDISEFSPLGNRITISNAVRLDGTGAFDDYVEEGRVAQPSRKRSGINDIMTRIMDLRKLYSVNLYRNTLPNYRENSDKF